jgi:transposase
MSARSPGTTAHGERTGAGHETVRDDSGDHLLRFVHHPITNGVAEGLNRKIMSIKPKAGGFRNVSNSTTAIDLHCGGLAPIPDASKGRNMPDVYYP